MKDCVFCAIIRGEAPASRVYEDECALAFMDIRPVDPGHVLIVPRAHVASLAEVDAETGAHLFRVAMLLAPAVRRSGVACQGINLFLADGRAAGQEVLHVHLHIVPRFAGDGFGFQIGPGNFLQPGRSTLDGIAERIRAALQG
jgi:diadenosine tetraphosphate (Ap4A) HIT family hydrolase